MIYGINPLRERSVADGGMHDEWNGVCVLLCIDFGDRPEKGEGLASLLAFTMRTLMLHSHQMKKRSNY